MNYIEQKVWQDSNSSVWKEIVSRFGQAEYDDVSKRTGHIATLKAEWDAKVYARNRKAKYDLLNQDEMRYDDTKNSTTTWVDAIDAIKAEFPKP
jgi:hypothetical protein